MKIQMMKSIKMIFKLKIKNKKLKLQNKEAYLH